jgi:hypothetical protein
MGVELNTVRELKRQDFAEVDTASLAVPQKFMGIFNGFVEVDVDEFPFSLDCG